jgi:hypothetical protein
MRTTRARDRAYAAELATFRAYAATTCPALSAECPERPQKAGMGGSRQPPLPFRRKQHDLI